MNALKTLAVIAVLAVVAVAPSQARERGKTAWRFSADRAAEQLGRGIANVGTGFVDIPSTMVEVKEEQGEIAGATVGTIKGVGRAVTRMVVGVFEVVTFPAGRPPIVEPEFVLQDRDTVKWKIRSRRKMFEDVVSD